MSINRFVYVYPGNGRPTGRVCNMDHEYDHPEEVGRVGTWVGPDCWHNSTDGYATTASLEEINAKFLQAEHLEFGHPEAVDGCPRCQATAPAMKPGYGDMATCPLRAEPENGCNPATIWLLADCEECPARRTT